MADAFTYDDIYELLRSEKFSSDLQPLIENDLKHIKEYLNAKRNLLNQQGADMTVISMQKRSKIQLEIDNAIRTIKDLYELRERKIINRALYSTRSDSVLRDTTNMLTHEEEFYSMLVLSLPTTRQQFFNIIEGKSNGTPQLTPAEVNPIHNVEPESLPIATPKPIAPEPAPEEVSSPIQAKEQISILETRRIKVKEDIPELIGEDLQKYGPFTIGETVDVPEVIAKLLIGQEKAESVEDIKDDVPATERSETEQGSEISKENEVPETNQDVLSKVQKAHAAQDQTSQDKTPTENQEERFEMGRTTDV